MRDLTQEQREQIENTLNELLIKCNDAKEGFIKAAGMVEDEGLKNFLMNKSEERIEFATDIENEIIGAGGEVNSTSSILSSIHRVWMEIQNTFTSDAKVVLAECLRGEYAAKDDYSQASVAKGLPGSTRAMILRQREAIKKTIGELKRWYAVMYEDATA